MDVLYFDGKSFFETEELKEIKKNYITYYARKGDYSRVMTGPQMLHEMIAMDEYRSSLCLQFISSVHYRRGRAFHARQDEASSYKKTLS